MSQVPPPPPDSTDDLQFATVEAVPIDSPASPAVASTQVCLGCHQPITSEYYAIGDKVICASCRARIDSGPSAEPVTGFAKATLYGLGAGLVGALIWYLVRHFLNIQLGLIALLVGFMVGKAVRKSSGGRGGPSYQVLAVVLTYACIAANYMPDLYEAPMQSGNEMTAVLWGRLYIRAIRQPFLSGAENIMGLVIIAIALYEAWKLAAGGRLPITGPYQVGSRFVQPATRGVPPMGPGGIA